MKPSAVRKLWKLQPKLLPYLDDKPAQQVAAGRIWGIAKPAVFRRLESCLRIRPEEATSVASFELQMPDWP